MSRFACIVALIALVVAPSVHVQATPVPASAQLDPGRVFNPAAESLLSALFVPTRDLSPLALALFDAPGAAFVSPPQQLTASAGGTAVIAAVHLRAYAAPEQLPSAPLSEPSVVPVAPAPARRLVQPVSAVPAVAVAPSVRVNFGSYAPYQPSVQSLNENVQVPVRVGGVHFSGSVRSSQVQTQHPDAVRAMQLCGTTDEAAACPYLHDESAQSIEAATAFDVRAGNTKVNLQLSGSVGRVNGHDNTLYQYAPLDPELQADTRPGSTQDSALLYYPGLTQMVQHALGARLAVPVSPAISIGLQYNRSHYQGDYATLLAPGIDATKDTYLGNVTYQLPNSSSFFTLSARQYRYQDSFAPNFSLTETRADLSFTVKF